MQDKNKKFLGFWAIYLAVLFVLSPGVLVLGDEVIDDIASTTNVVTEDMLNPVEPIVSPDSVATSSADIIIDITAVDTTTTSTEAVSTIVDIPSDSMVMDTADTDLSPEENYGTDKSGEVVSDEVWDKASGPYHVSDLYIPSGVTVTVEAGTEIYTSGYIAVFGKLKIEGDETDKVTMGIEDYTSYWYIHVGEFANLNISHASIDNLREISSTNGFLDMDHVDILDTVNGIYLNHYASLFADNIIIGGLSDNINLLASDNSTLNLSHAEIDNTFGGNDYIIQGYQNSKIKISDSKILGGDSTPVIVIGGSLEITNTDLIGGEDGVFAMTDTRGGKVTQSKINISNSTISDFARDGIFAVDPDMVISESEISGNDVGIETYSRDAFNIVINHSIIEGNNIGVIYGDQSEGLARVVFDVRDNFWGDKSGPFILDKNESGVGDGVLAYNGAIDKVMFNPWLKAPYSARVPVVIIPGIMGSYLNHDDEGKTEVWPRLKTIIAFPSDTILDDLIMNNVGILNNENDIISNNIFSMVDELGVKIDFFDGLITKLKSDGYVEGKDLFVFPYDWRLDVVDNVMGNKYSKVESLKDKIDKVLRESKSDKVDIVAHSMGGLLAKYYIKNVDATKVNRFVDIGTPHLGAPKAAKVLNYGDNMDIKFGMFGLNPLEIKKISQNMPSAYNLLPSADYFDTTNPDYLYYMYDIGDVDGDGHTGRLDHAGSHAFLVNIGRNNLLLQNADNIHRDLDGFDPGTVGVATYNIVGCGTPTIGKILTNKKSFKDDFEYHLKYISGDGTVPMRSAEGIPSIYEYYATGVEHATMPSQDGVRDLVSAIITNTGTDFSYKDTANISSGSDNCKIPDGKIVSIHSPVALHIYDTDGHHTGPIDNGDIEYGVVGVIYDTVEDNKFAYIPDGLDVEVKISATGTGHVGIDVQDYVDGEISKSEVFDNIEVDNMSAKGEILIDQDESEVIFDKDGTGQKQILKPNTTIDGDIPISQNTDDTNNEPDTANTKSTTSGSRRVVLKPQPIDDIITNVPTPDFNTLETVTPNNPKQELKPIPSNESNIQQGVSTPMENVDIHQSASVGDSKIFANIFNFVKDIITSIFNKIINYLS
jgi:Lecithin:cholesterol acyltransferase